MFRSTKWLGWMIVAYLFAAAVFELALAIGRITAPSGAGFVILGALVAMLIGAGLGFRRGRHAGLIAPAAALFVVAFFYTGDPYYDPTFRSYAEGGIFSPAWIYLLLALASVAGISAQVWRRAAAVASVAVLVLLMFTTMFMGSGH